MLPLLDDEDMRTHLHNHSCRLNEIRMFGQQSRFAVVNDKAVDAGENLLHFIESPFDPEVHCVADDELGIGHLIENLPLEHGIDIAKTDELCVSHRIGNYRIEVEQDVQLRVERIAVVQVEMIAPAPAEGLAPLLDDN